MGPPIRQTEQVDLPVLPPITPMLAKPAKKLPAGWMLDPKWDGFRSIIFRDGDEVVLGSRNEKPLTRYFPELVEAARRQLPPRCVIDGEIVIARGLNPTHLDFEALQQRIHPAESRITLLSEQTPAAFIAFDLLAVDDKDLMDLPFRERRAHLEELFDDATEPEEWRGAVPPTGVHLSPLTQDHDEGMRWFVDFEGAGLDGIIAKDPEASYQPGKRVLVKLKHERTADCVLAGYRVHKSGPDAIGSLLLGLYDERGVLNSVGVAASFTMARRRELMEELAPWVTDLEGHPWNWAAHLEGERTPRKNEQSRWNAGKDLSFVPLRPERVVEVRYDYLEGQRFRHIAQFVRWRPDREPASCTYDQLERPGEYDLADVLGAVR